MVQISKLSKNKRRLIIIICAVPYTIILSCAVLATAFIEFWLALEEMTIEMYEKLPGVIYDLWNDPKPIEKENSEDLWSDI